MSGTSKQSQKVTKSVSKSASVTGTDSVKALQQLEKSTRKSASLTPVERRDRRTTMGRAPRTFLNLMLSFAEQSDNTIGSVTLDPASMQQQLAEADRLMLGVSAARNVARRLEDAALTASGAVAKRALWALQSLETEAKTPEGSGLLQKAEELRAEVRKARKKPRTSTGAAKTAKTATVADAVDTVAEPPPAATTTETTTVAAGH